MNQFFSKSQLWFASLSLLVFCPQPLMALVPNNVGVILNSGSTNTIGYRIYVSPTGEVRYVDGKGSGTGKLSKNLTKKFFNDLNVAAPLSTLPIKQPCIKSTSFGTVTTVSLGSQQSPDISCPGNAKAKTLDNDVTAIVKALKVINVPKSKGTPLPPQNF